MSEGTAPVIQCPNCGHLNVERGRFCPQCGYDMGHVVTGKKKDPMIGVVIADRYRVVKPLGHGGMGVVYQVEHIVMGKIMAMKLLHASFRTRPQAVKRFRQEIKVVSKLSHIHTVSVFDCGSAHNGSLFIVMEYLNGLDLEKLLEHEKSLPCWRAARIARQVCSALVEAHELGVIHRDIKPGNIMLLRDQGAVDFVKVLDFGIAKLTEPSEELVTETGLIVGTPFYMAPEQAMGRDDLGAAVDVYSLGIVLYEMLTGRLPFQGETTSDYLSAHLREIPKAPSLMAPEQGIDPNIDRLVLKALEKKPEKRFRSVTEFREQLDLYLAEKYTHPESKPSAAQTSQIHTGDILDAQSVAGIPNSEQASEPSTEKATSEDKTECDEVQAYPVDLVEQRGVPTAEQQKFLRAQAGQGATASKRDASTPLEGLDGRREPRVVVSTPPPPSFYESPVLPPSESQEPEPERLATRADWDKVEVEWKRSRRMRFWLPLLLLCGGLVYVHYKYDLTVLWEQWRRPRAIGAQTQEQEPNNTVKSATPIHVGRWISGRLGLRLSETSSDRDWYTFLLPPGKRHRLSFVLEPPKSLDVEISLMRLEEVKQNGRVVRRRSRLLFSLNNRMRGGVERIPAYTFAPGRYYLAVREILVQGEAPQENSGRYRFRLQRQTIKREQEQEPNDNQGQAGTLEIRTRLFGFHDRRNDIDFYRITLRSIRRGRKPRARIRFFHAGKIRPELLLLYANGRPYSVRPRVRTIRVFRTVIVKGKKRRVSERRRISDVYLSGIGEYYLRVRSVGVFDDMKPYEVLVTSR